MSLKEILAHIPLCKDWSDAENRCGCWEYEQREKYREYLSTLTPEEQKKHFEEVGKRDRAYVKSLRV